MSHLTDARAYSFQPKEYFSPEGHSVYMAFGGKQVLAGFSRLQHLSRSSSSPVVPGSRSSSISQLINVTGHSPS